MTIEMTYQDIPQRFDRWMKKTYPRVGFGLLQKWLRTGQIRVNKKRVKTDYMLQQGDLVRFPPQFNDFKAPLTKTDKPTGNKKTRSLLQQSIVYEDDSCIVINKPQGLAVQGGTNLRDYIDLYLDSLLEGQQDTLRITHRLDKDTSGLLILAKTQDAAQYYTKAFQNHRIQKIYQAVLVGRPQSRVGIVNLSIGKLTGHDREKMSSQAETVMTAETKYRVVQYNPDYDLCLMEFQPLTGRTHQLRVHAFEGLGCPILGDGKYGGKDAHPDLPDDILPLHNDELTLHLCAMGLSFEAMDGRPVKLMLPLPDHFVTV